jgi:hypothetical protein
MSEHPLPDHAVLNDFWNEVIQPTGASVSGDDLDQATVETIRWLQDLGAAPPPASSRERVRRALSARKPSLLDKGTGVNPREILTVARPASGTNGRIEVMAEPWSRVRLPSGSIRPAMPVTTERSVTSAWLTAVLVILMGLAFSIGLTRTGIPQRGALEQLVAVGDNAERSAMATTLLRVPISSWSVGPPLATLSSLEDSGGNAWRIDIYRLTLQSGAHYQDPDVDVGMVITGVEHGIAAISVDGPATLILHGEEGPTDVPAGATIDITPGDALLTTGGQRRTIHPGSEKPVTILDVRAHRGGIMKNRFQLISTGVAPEVLPPEPLELTIERITLPHAAVLPMPVGAVVLVRVESGIVTRTDARSLTNLLQPGQFFTYRPGGYFVAESVDGGSSDVQAVEGPAELILVTFAPVAAASP